MDAPTHLLTQSFFKDNLPSFIKGITQNALKIGIVIVGILGLVNASYLSLLHVFPEHSCIGGFKCSSVLESHYSSVLGLPLAGFGVAWFLSLVLFVFLSPTTKASHGLGLGLAISGLAVSLILLITQGFLIRAWCPLCIVSTTLTTAASLGLILAIRISQITTGRNSHATKMHILICLPLITIPLVVGFLSEQSSNERLNRSINEKVICRIGDRRITMQELEIATRLDVLNYQDKQQKAWLDQQVLDEASKMDGISTDNYLISKVGDVSISKEEIDREYKNMRPDMPLKFSESEAKGEIVALLASQKRSLMIEAEIDNLKESIGFEYTPLPKRSVLPIDKLSGFPRIGPEDAKNYVVVFTDFNCHFCNAIHKEIISSTLKNVAFYFVCTPLQGVEGSDSMANIALAAQNQGKFWETASHLFEHNSTTKIEDIPAKVGLDPELLNKDSKSVKKLPIHKQLGKSMGVTRTPAIFVNGRYLPPFDPSKFEQILKSHL